MYTMTYPGGVLRLNGAVIEQDDRLPEYQAYVLWLTAGNGPEPVFESIEVAKPRIEVSAWQIREALNRLGRRAEIEAMIEGSNDISMRDGWLHADVFKSDHEFIKSMGQAAGMNDAELHALFEFAASLQL